MLVSISCSIERSWEQIKKLSLPCQTEIQFFARKLFLAFLCFGFFFFPPLEVQFLNNKCSNCFSQNKAQSPIFLLLYESSESMLRTHALSCSLSVPQSVFLQTWWPEVDGWRWAAPRNGRVFFKSEDIFRERKQFTSLITKLSQDGPNIEFDLPR